MTRELLQTLPANVVNKINELKRDYNNPALRKDEVQNKIAGYALGLRDAGLITERGRQILFVYATV